MKKTIQIFHYEATFVPTNKQLEPFIHQIEAFSKEDAEETFNIVASMWDGKFENMILIELP